MQAPGGCGAWSFRSRWIQVLQHGVFSCRLLSKDSLPDCAGVLGQTCSLASSEASEKEAPKAEAGGPPMKRPACSNERIFRCCHINNKSEKSGRQCHILGVSLLDALVQFLLGRFFHVLSILNPGCRLCPVCLAKTPSRLSLCLFMII